jgi:hypothetical protein
MHAFALGLHFLILGETRNAHQKTRISKQVTLGRIGFFLAVSVKPMINLSVGEYVERVILDRRRRIYWFTF